MFLTSSIYSTNTIISIINMDLMVSVLSIMWRRHTSEDKEGDKYCPDQGMQHQSLHQQRSLQTIIISCNLLTSTSTSKL